MGFELTGRLPQGTVLLEASAGTGKTFAIASLTLRYIAEEGLDIGRLLLITFTNNAAAELRSRVYAFLVSAIDALEDEVVPDAAEHPVEHHLVTATDRALSLSRLRDARDGFDRATVTTTHAFSQLMLTELGVLADADHNETLTEASSLIDECAADVYLEQFRGDEEPPLKRWEAFRIAGEACRTMLAIEPAGSVEQRYASAVRELFEARKARLGILTFNDLISRLSAVLADEELGPTARDWLRQRYEVVFVDEFQDTDTLQWEILRRAFVDERRTTILIGDPKQSIYGFRDADLASYLDARSQAGHETLGTNYRSDPGVVDAVVSLFDGLELGDASIKVAPVRAAKPERLGAPGTSGVRMRRVPAGRPGRVDEIVRDDVAVQVREILGYRVDGNPVQLDDIAILTRTSRTASRITARLSELGLDAVQFGGASPWRQPAADDWMRLLEALSQPAGAGRRAAALTDLVGAGVEDLASPTGATHVWEVLTRTEHALLEHGAGAALDVLRSGTALEARCLPMPGGGRYVTDLQHIAELLDAAGLRDATRMLRQMEQWRRQPDGSDVRVVSDAPAIKVMTMHSAKGLEFPFVLLPEMSTLHTLLDRPFQLIEDETGRRSLWVAPADEEGDVGRLALRQARDEELRLLYVGLTRAKHLAIAWHTQTDAAARGPLSAALFRDRGAPHLADGYAWREAPEIPGVLVSDVTDAAPRREDRSPAPPELTLAEFTREVDPDWRRTSYTGLTSGLHDAPSGADEPAELSPGPADDTLKAPAPMGALPAGAAFGTLVHEVLERLDWRPEGLEGRVAELVEEIAVGFDAESRRALVDGLQAVVRTPLEPLAAQPLGGIPLARRLPELDFDLPMATTAGLTIQDLAEEMARHLEDDDPLAAYPARLRASAAASQRLQGLLTGSIDAVLELEDGRFVVVDYKTNRLAPSPDAELTLGHYTRPAMAEAMMSAHYPLQAILYCAALHRFLARRLPGYDPAHHLGGVGYLFVRGMAGPETPAVDGHRTGVFAWYPPAELVVAVSDLLGGRHA